MNKGRLVPTRAGTAVSDDPVSLAHYVAERAGSLRREPFARELTALLLLRVAAGRTVDDEAARRWLVTVLGELGWSSAGRPLEPWGLFWADETVSALLGVLGCSGGIGGRATVPSPAARSVARLALRSMP